MSLFCVVWPPVLRVTDNASSHLLSGPTCDNVAALSTAARPSMQSGCPRYAFCRILTEEQKITLFTYIVRPIQTTSIFCVCKLRAPTRNLFTYLLTYLRIPVFKNFINCPINFTIGCMLSRHRQTVVGGQYWSAVAPSISIQSVVVSVPTYTLFGRVIWQIVVLISVLHLHLRCWSWYGWCSNVAVNVELVVQF